MVGKAKNEFFIINETSHAVSFFASEADLNRAIAERRLGTPTADRLTPAAGGVRFGNRSWSNAVGN